jgi:hypothetical protein
MTIGENNKEAMTVTEIVTEANKQIEIANQEISRQESMNEELVKTLETTFTGTLSVIIESLDQIAKAVWSIEEERDLWLFLGEITALREFMVGFTRVYTLVHQSTYDVSSDFTKVSLVIGKKIELLVLTINQKIKKINEGTL